MLTETKLGSLPAVLEKPKSPKPPSFLLTHGAGGGIEAPGLAALSGGLAAAGHAALRFELPYRAQGRKSPPKAELSVPGWQEAFEEAAAQLGRAPVVCGGKSYGGRVASLAVAGGMPAAGLLFYGYPLHAPGKSSEARVDHWPQISVPTLFLQGTRDALCDLKVLEKNLGKLGGPATLVVVDGGDHSLKTGKSKEAEVIEGLIPKILEWAEGLATGSKRRT